jgi:hypothetical protein
MPPVSLKLAVCRARLFAGCRLFAIYVSPCRKLMPYQRA